MKKIFLILVLITSTSVHANLYEELTGEAAAKRTQEAQARAQAARVRAQAARQQAAQKRQEIANKRAQMEADKKAMEAWYTETKTFVAHEVTKMPSRSDQIARLHTNLLDQVAKVKVIKDAFKIYADQVVKCSKAAEGALVISKLASSQQIGTGNLLMSYAMARQENDLLQLAGLNSLAWNRGYEAMYSTLPAAQHLEAQLKAFIVGVNLESATETMNLINNVLAGLELQAERAAKLLEGSNNLKVAYQEIHNEMQNKK